MSLARNIKQLRKKRGLSQDRLSKIADISYNTVLKIESGSIQSPGINTASKIARALKVSIDDLIR